VIEWWFPYNISSWSGFIPGSTRRSTSSWTNIIPDIIIPSPRSSYISIRSISGIISINTSRISFIPWIIQRRSSTSESSIVPSIPLKSWGEGHYKQNNSQQNKEAQDHFQEHKESQRHYNHKQNQAKQPSQKHQSEPLIADHSCHNISFFISKRWLL